MLVLFAEVVYVEFLHGVHMFGDLHTLSFVRLSLLNWIGYVNRMDSKRKVSQVFNNNPQGSQLRGRPKNRWWNCVQNRH
jgi:hypothetical protein